MGFLGTLKPCSLGWFSELGASGFRKGLIVDSKRPNGSKATIEACTISNINPSYCNTDS